MNNLKKAINNKLLLTILGISLAISAKAADESLWDLAHKNKSVLSFSTLFTAQNVREYLTSDEGIDNAIQWCKDTAVTHVYLESFRGGYTPNRDVLLKAKTKFLDAGFQVSGCITTTKLGRDSVNGWSFPCFTDPKALETLQSAFEFAASLFNEVMIDDFFATGCECEDCVKARGDQSWAEYRCDLLAGISQKNVINPARKVNPNVTIIIKYPQWYDNFHNRGYEVVRQSDMFNKIWVGTETRDPDNQRWGRKAQYEAYFIMRWLGKIGGEKCGGGWFDPYGTTPPTYLEQARQTIQGGARQALLFCYGSLQNDTGPENIKALRKEIPDLFKLAELIHGKQPCGISAPKIPNSDGGNENYVYDFIGMLGLPLVPATEIHKDGQAFFLPVHTAKDPAFAEKIKDLLDKDIPVLISDELAEKMPAILKERIGKNQIINTPKDLWELMDIPPEQLKAIRSAMLKPFGIEFNAPSRVALYLFDSDTAVIENFNDKPVEASIQFKSASSISSPLSIPNGSSLSTQSNSAAVKLLPRSLIVLRIGG